jgi:UDP-N-acetylmuramoyl-tripeptide--D-alanyl-D-alanine ligase
LFGVSFEDVSLLLKDSVKLSGRSIGDVLSWLVYLSFTTYCLYYLGSVSVMQLSLDQLAELLKAQCHHCPPALADQLCLGLTTDSRQVSAGQVFLALKGERFDGHGFVATAIASGAIAAIVSTPLPDAIPQLVVPDTLVAYHQVAQWWRQQWGQSLVAVTGSVGKTTTKELIAAVLAPHGSVLKTQANYNNEIGVPKTLLELTPAHRFGVVEMAMRGPGEIALLAQTAQPEIGVITNVGTAHIGRLGSRAAIAAAKCELLAEMPADGLAILNADDSLLLTTARSVWSGRTLTYGLTGGDLTGQLLDPQTLVVDGVTLPLPLPGRHNALNYLAAIAVLQALNLDWRGLTAGIPLSLPSGRGQRYDLSPDLVLLDETYNAGAESMTAALHLLAETPGQRRIAILGTMKELGEHSVALHRQVGETVGKLGIDHLVTLAEPPEAAALAAGAAPVPTQVCSHPAEVVAYLKDLVQPGDRLLFKASRSVALDQVVSQLRTALMSPATDEP